MIPAAAERALIAYAVGALLACAAYVAEVGLTGADGRIGAGIVYSLLGGALASAARVTLVRPLPAPAARIGALFVVSAFGALHLLSFANTRLLAGTHYLSPESLALDALVLGSVFFAARRLALSSRLQVVRIRWGTPISGLGGMLLLAGAGSLVFVWPRAEPDPSRRGDGPNLLLLVLDSVRSDHLGLHGYPPPTTPQLDRLALDARVFERAYSASSWTVPSVATLLAGPNGERLAETLAKSGYVSACFTDNPHLSSGAELLQGFDHVERSVGRGRDLLRGTALGNVIERLDPGDDKGLVNRAVTWAGERKGPVFLYAHLMDAHTPYRHAPIDGRKRAGRRIEFPVSGMPMTAGEAEDVVARYDGGIRSAATEAARLITAAKGWGRPFLAIVTSDHGESLGEMGRWFHGGSLAPELLAIPILLLGDGVSAERVPGPVGHAQIPSTFLAAAGTDCAACASSDLRRIRASQVVEGGLPPYLRYRVVWPYKVTVDSRDGNGRLFDRSLDSLEHEDLARRRPKLLETLARGLDRAWDRAVPLSEGTDRLRALGYVQ